MASQFQIVAQVRLQLDQGSLLAVTQGAQRSLQGLSTVVNVDAGASRAVLAGLTSGAAASQGALRALRAQNEATGTSMKALATLTGEARLSVEGFAAQMGLAARRALAFSLAAGSIYRVVTALRDAGAAAVEFDRGMVRIAQISSETSPRLAGIEREISRVSRAFGVSSNDLLKGAFQLKQAGLSVREVESAVGALAKTSLSGSFGSQEQTISGLVAALRQFRLEVSQAENVLGSINAAAAAYAVSSDDIIQAVQRTGGVFRAAGGDFNQFIGQFVAVRQTTQESAETIATGLRTIFTRLQRNDTIAALKELGVELRHTRDEAAALGDVGLAGQFVGIDEAIRRVAEATSGLRETDSRFSAITEQLGGYRQISRVLPLLREQKLAQEAANVAAAGSISLSIEAEKAQSALSVKVQKVKETYLELGRDALNSSTFQAIAGALGSVALGFEKILRFVSPLVPLLTTLAAIKVAAALPGIVNYLGGAFLGAPGARTQPLSALPKKFAAGGVVPGSGYTDSVPASLTPGEFVVRQDSARRIGYDNLHALNDGGRVRLAGGGPPGDQAELARLFRKNLAVAQGGLDQLGVNLPLDRVAKGLILAEQRGGVFPRSYAEHGPVGIRGIEQQDFLRGLVESFGQAAAPLFSRQEYRGYLPAANAIRQAGKAVLPSVAGRVGRRPAATQFAIGLGDYFGQLYPSLYPDLAGGNGPGPFYQPPAFPFRGRAAEIGVFLDRLQELPPRAGGAETLFRPHRVAGRPSVVEPHQLFFEPGNQRFYSQPAFARGGPVRLASGGDPSDLINRLIFEASDRTGINFFKAATGVRLASNHRARGSFYFQTGDVLLRQGLLGDHGQLRRTLVHELTHGLDSLAGGLPTRTASEVLGFGGARGSENHPLVRFIRSYQEGAVRPFLKGRPGPLSPRELEYRLKPLESLAYGVGEGLAGGYSGLTAAESGPVLDELRRSVVPFFRELTGPGKPAYSSRFRFDLSGGQHPARLSAQRILHDEHQKVLSLVGGLAGPRLPGVKFLAGGGPLGRTGFPTPRVTPRGPLGAGPVNPELVGQLLEEFGGRSGVDFSRLVSGVSLTRDLKGVLFGHNAPIQGGFQGKYEQGRVVLNSALIRDEASLRSVLARTLGEAALSALGQGGLGKLARTYGRREGLLSGAGADEGFVNLFSNLLTGNRNIVDRLLSPRFGSILAGLPGRGFAAGGSPTDTVPALLTPGEFVLNRDAAASIGRPALELMNAHGRLPGYALGGFVRAADGRLIDRIRRKAFRPASDPSQAGFSAEGLSEPEAHPLSAFRGVPEVLGPALEEARRLGVGINEATQVFVRFRSTGQKVFQGIVQNAEGASAALAETRQAVEKAAPAGESAALSPGRAALYQSKAHLPERLAGRAIEKDPRLAPFRGELEVAGGKALLLSAQTHEEQILPGVFGPGQFLPYNPSRFVSGGIANEAQRIRRELGTAKFVPLVSKTGETVELRDTSRTPEEVRRAQEQQQLREERREQARAVVGQAPAGLPEGKGLHAQVLALRLKPGRTIAQNRQILADYARDKLAPPPAAAAPPLRLPGATLLGGPLRLPGRTLADESPGRAAGGAAPPPPSRPPAAAGGTPPPPPRPPAPPTGLPPEPGDRFSRKAFLEKYLFSPKFGEFPEDAYRRSAAGSLDAFNRVRLGPRGAPRASPPFTGPVQDPRFAAYDAAHPEGARRNFVGPLPDTSPAPRGDLELPPRAADEYQRLRERGFVGPPLPPPGTVRPGIDPATNLRGNLELPPGLPRFAPGPASPPRQATGGRIPLPLAAPRAGPPPLLPGRVATAGGVQYAPGAGVATGPDVRPRVLAPGPAAGPPSQLGSRTLAYDELLAERAGARASAEIARRTALSGGLSETTKAEIENAALNSERAKLSRELSSAQRRLLDVTQREVVPAERALKAREEVRAAVDGQARVAVGARGQVLGTEAAVAQASALGRSAPGAGGFLYGAGNVARAAAGGVGTGFVRGAQALQASPFGRVANALQPAAFPSLFALPLAAGYLDPGELKSAEGTTSFGFRKAASSGLQAGVLGGVIGQAALTGAGAGPAGALLGALVGAGLGIVSAISETADQIRQVRINNALTSFADALANLDRSVRVAAEDFPGRRELVLDPGLVSGARGQLAEFRGESFEKNYKESKGFLGIGFNDREFLDLQRKSVRQDLGQQLPFFTKLLQEQAVALGRANPLADTRSLAARLEGGNAGFNRELLELSAQIKGVKVGDVLKEFERSIRQAQRAQVVEDRNRDARAGEERNATSFGRLVLAAQSASDSLLTLRLRAAALSDLFEGQVNATRVTANTEALQGFGRGDRGALRPLELIASVGGEAGRRLLSAGTAVQDVKRLLPSVLSEVRAGNPLEGADVATQVERRLAELLGGGRLEGERRDVVNTVLRGLNELTSGENKTRPFNEAVASDVTALTDKLLDPYEGAVRDAGTKFGKKIEEETNLYLEGLVTARRQLAAIGEGRDRVNTLVVAAYRQGLEFDAQNAGRRNQFPFLLDLGRLQEPFRLRQERLTGLGGALAESPEAIGAELADVRRRIGEATKNQQDVFRKPGGKGPEFEAASRELVRLKGRAADLVQALGHLTNAAERGAPALERLQALQQERDSRVSFGERFISAGPEERFRINRGLILARAANERGNLDNLTSEDAGLVLQTLRSLGRSTLPGLEGGPVAADLADRLVRQSYDGTFDLTGGQKAQEGELQKTLREQAEAAKAAQEKIVENQNAASDGFFQSLTQAHERFFRRLAQELLRNQVADVEAKLGTARDKQGTFKGLGEQRDLLARAGVTTDEQVGALQRSRADLQKLFEGRAEQGRVRELFSGLEAQADDIVREAFGDKDPYASLLFGKKERARFQNVLAEKGLTGDQAESVKRFIAARFNKDSTNEDFRRDLRLGLNLEGQERAKEIFRDKIAPVRSDLEGRGLPVGAIEDEAGRSGATAFLAALDAFSGGKNTLAKLADESRKAGDEVDKLAQRLKELQSAAGGGDFGPVQGRASGGPIFAARGSDTVPAMLTPGEFVVNRDSARANPSLLDRLNAARGPLYLAGGGRIDYDTTVLRRPLADLLDPPPLAAAAGNAALAAADAARDTPKAEDPDAALRRDLAYQAAVNPFGASAQYLAREQARARVERAQKARDARRLRDFDLAKFGDGPRAELARRRLDEEARRADRLDRFGGEKALDEFRVQQAGSFAAGRVNFLGDLANLRKRQRAALTGGDFSQRQIAGNVFQSEQNVRNRFVSNDPFYDVRNFDLRRVRPQVVPIGLRRFAGGGVVPGAGATDTIPSLLTPGEFVLNRDAVSRAGVGALQQFNRGGPVRHMAEGGPVGPGSDSTSSSQELTRSLNEFTKAARGLEEVSSSLSRSFNVFAGDARGLSEALNNMPRTLTGEFTHSVNVTLNGAEALARMTPEIKSLVVQQVKDTLGRVFKENLPEAGVTL